MLLRRICLALMLSGVAVEGNAGRENEDLARDVIALDSLRPEEAAKTVRQLVPGILVRARGKGLFVRGGHQQLQLVRDLVGRIDIPVCRNPTVFVEMAFEDVGKAADFVSRLFGDGDAGFHAIPDFRTNRVFLMGDAQTLRDAEELLRQFDRNHWRAVISVKDG